MKKGKWGLNKWAIYVEELKEYIHKHVGIE